MSYILDALKKAEKERQRNNAVSELLTGSDTVSREQNKRALRHYLLLFVLLLNAGLFFWLFGPWNSKRPVPVQEQAEKTRTTTSSQIVRERSDVGPPTSLPPVLAKSESSRLEVRKPEQQSQTAQVSASAKTEGSLRHAETKAVLDMKVPASAKPGAVKEKTGTARAVAKQVPPEDRISSDQTQVSKAGIPGGDKVYKMNELPQSILSSLPSLSLSLHLYNADPSSRLISVKGRTLHEGQELTAGLKLEAINPEGAVFSFQNYRFQVGLNSQ